MAAAAVVAERTRERKKMEMEMKMKMGAQRAAPTMPRGPPGAWPRVLWAEERPRCLKLAFRVSGVESLADEGRGPGSGEGQGGPEWMRVRACGTVPIWAGEGRTGQW